MCGCGFASKAKSTAGGARRTEIRETKRKKKAVARQQPTKWQRKEAKPCEKNTFYHKTATHKAATKRAETMAANKTPSEG
jgi:hypothetical protein